jgi:hypothetical protein
MHEYTIEFRISGNDLNVSAVTERLELEPSLVRNVGERRSETTKWEEALRSYNGFPASVGSKSWKSLEEGLTFVLEKLWPLRHKIDTYKGNFKLILWCSNFQTAANGGPTLSPAILKRLGDFGVELFIDNYCCEDLDRD